MFAKTHWGSQENKVNTQKVLLSRISICILEKLRKEFVTAKTMLNINRSAEVHLRDELETEHWIFTEEWISTNATHGICLSTDSSKTIEYSIAKRCSQHKVETRKYGTTEVNEMAKEESIQNNVSKSFRTQNSMKHLHVGSIWRPTQHLASMAQYASFPAKEPVRKILGKKGTMELHTSKESECRSTHSRNLCWKAHWLWKVRRGHCTITKMSAVTFLNGSL